MLLVWWMDIPGRHPTEPYQVIEFFAGVGRIASLAKHCGYKSAAVDLTYGQDVGASLGKRSPMDLNSNAGMVFRVCMYIYLKKIYIYFDLNSGLKIWVSLLGLAFVPKAVY